MKEIRATYQSPLVKVVILFECDCISTSDELGVEWKDLWGDGSDNN